MALIFSAAPLANASFLTGAGAGVETGTAVLAGVALVVGSMLKGGQG
jgi:hypothetical protein